MTSAWSFDWLNHQHTHQIAWSALAVFVALVFCWTVLQHGRLNRGRLRILKRKVPLVTGVTFLLLLVLAQIWDIHIFGEPDSRKALLLKNLVWTAVSGLVLYILVRTCQRRLIDRSTSIEDRHKIRVMTAWVGIVLFAIVALFIWASKVDDLGLFLGILGAGVALAMQETLLTLAGWLLLVVRRPYDIGDRIEVDGNVGDVIDIGIFQTTMLEVGKWVRADQSTGRLLITPNSMVVRHAIFNYTKGFPFVWDEFTAIVTYESDWETARILMLEQAEIEASKYADEVKRQIELMQGRYAIHYEHLNPIVYTAVVDNGIALTLRHLTPVRHRRMIENRLAENILRLFIPHEDIEFAYPTTRFFRDKKDIQPDKGPASTGD